MAGDQPISWLMFLTFAATIFAIVGALIHFLRCRRNREIAVEALAGGDRLPVNKGANGALPNLLGVALLAFIAMGLLTFGVRNEPAQERAEKPPLVEQQQSR